MSKVIQVKKEVAFEDLEFTNIKLKCKLLEATDENPLKLMFGLKFAPHEYLLKKQRDRVKQDIKSGFFTKKFNDFIFGKIASLDQAKEIVEIAGWTAAVSTILFTTINRSTMDEIIRKSKDSFHYSFWKGYREGLQLMKNKEGLN